MNELGDLARGVCHRLSELGRLVQIRAPGFVQAPDLGKINPCNLAGCLLSCADCEERYPQRVGRSEDM